jgi:hypothetical protein
VLAAGGEIVVVDNGSTDGTDEVVLQLAARHGDGIRLVSEPRPGASVARNTGARAIRHDVLCLIDDDARPAPGWFEHLRDAFTDPVVAVAGGPVRGLFPADRDPEFPRAAYAGYVSVLDIGDAVGNRNPVAQPAYGANWAMRTEVWRAAGGLPEDLGVNDRRKFNGEETALEIAVHGRGMGECRWAPGASVGHRIGGERLNETYFLLRSFRCGVESARVWDHRAGGRSAELLGADVERGLGRVFANVVLPDGDVDDAYAAIVAAPISFARRMQATYALGSVVGAGHMLGERAWRLPDGALLEARPEHADGHVRVPVSVAA